ncbi:hypothetical protein [Nocardia salmonicida]
MSSKAEVFTVEVFGLTKREAEALIREALAGRHTYTINEFEGGDQ